MEGHYGTTLNNADNDNDHDMYIEKIKLDEFPDGVLRSYPKFKYVTAPKSKR